MNRIQNLNHNKETIIYSLSRLFERAAYYGIRSLVVLYMISESLKMTNNEALTVYGFFTLSYMFSQIFGALIGDLILSNKKALIIGGFIQSLGAFSFCIPSSIGLYLGIGLIVIGGGFYTPNMLSHYGKLYVNKTKLLDAAFTILYVAINIGSFLGVMMISLIGDKYGWNFGFISAGILMLISVALPLMNREVKISKKSQENIPLRKRIISIVISFILIALFWAIYEVSAYRTFDLQMSFQKINDSIIPKSMWSSLNTAFIIPIGILACVLWSFFYNNQFIKLAIGFITGAVSFGILFLIPEATEAHHLVLYLISLLLLSISEMLVGPIIYSVLTQYSNPKYLAIIISLIFIPSRLLNMLISEFNDEIYNNSSFVLKTGVIIMFAISIGLLGYNFIHRKTTA